MCWNGLRRPGWIAFTVALAVVALAGGATTASAQLVGEFRYLMGYVLSPNPPLASGPTTLTLFGDYPTNCGVVESAQVVDSAHVILRLRSTTCADSIHPRWV